MLTATWFKFSLILKHTCTSDEKLFADLCRCWVVEVAHRVNAAWGKFNKFRYVLTNGHVSIKGRLQLFHAVITPLILFGLGSLPLTKRQLEDIGVLRSIVGWNRVEGEAWSDTVRLMGSRVQFTLRQSPVTAWSEVHFFAVGCCPGFGLAGRDFS